MNRKEIDDQIAEIKADYARIQGDAEKLVLVGQSTTTAERKLIELEAELARLYQERDKLKED